MPRIQSGATADLLAVDPVSLAAHVSTYDSAGNLLTPPNRAAIALTAGGALQAGADFRVGRIQRVDETGGPRTNVDSILFFDDCEGAAVDTNKWLQTISTSTITQLGTTGVLFNANSTLTNGAGAMQTSNRKFPMWPGAALLYRAVARPTTHVANGVIELGFGAPAAVASATATDGAHWRKDTAGQWLPVVVINSTEYLGTPISNAAFTAAVPVTDYAVFTIELRHTAARFCIYTHGGTLVVAQDMDFTAIGTGVPGIAQTHVGVFEREYNLGTVVTTAVQFYRAAVSVTQLDAAQQRGFASVMSGASLGFWQSPTLYTQTPNFANQIAPTTRTPANTTEQETTLGGHVSWNNGGTSFGASDTVDLVLFGFTVPSPYSFVLTGLRLSTVNLGAANGAAPYTIEYALAVGHNSASLATTAPNAPRFIPLGFQSLAAAAAIGATFDKDSIWSPGTPIAVQPNRHIALVARVIGGSIATTSQVIRTIAAIDGYWE